MSGQIRTVTGGALAIVVLLAGTALLRPQAAAAQTEVVSHSSTSPAATQALKTAVPDAPAVETAWRRWMAQHNITQSTMALGQNHDILHTADAGRDAATPYPVANLSQAVTAMCMNDILADSEYNWSSTFEEMEGVLALANIKPHTSLYAVTLGDLATHSTRFPERLSAIKGAAEGANLYNERYMAFRAMREAAELVPIGRTTYSNINYAILGHITIALTWFEYADTCKDRVLVPAQVHDAFVGGEMSDAGSSSGWSVSAEDYARFVMYWFAPDRPWVMAPADFPFNAHTNSGLGVFHTETGTGGYVIEHAGLWDSTKADRQHGAIFLTTQTGATFVANWQGRLPKKAYSDLRTAVASYLH